MAGFEGLRVFRGPDWKGGDDDGGEGYLGTVTQSLSDQTVRVLWDMGQESTCSSGHDGKFELRIYDTAQVGVRHLDTTCTGCGQQGIWGILWRCQDCAGCDLCPVCYFDDKHDIRHSFLRIDTPGCEGQPFPKRKTSVKVRAIGIFPGSKVVRGKDWEWADQDGGLGSEGEVKGYEDVPSLACRSLVLVQWPNGESNGYRLGFRGKVDVKCVVEDVGPFYYRDHLPLLDTTKTSLVVSQSTSSNDNNASKTQQQGTCSDVPAAKEVCPEVFAANRGSVVVTEEKARTPVGAAEEVLSVVRGDRVAIKVPEEKLKELQQFLGGCTAGLARCIGKTGKVGSIRSDGAVCVDFGSDFFNYTLNPQALIKVAKRFSMDEIVRVRDDLELLKILNRRLTWISDMDKTAGLVGRICRISEEGDLMLDFKGIQFAYAPACVLPAPGATVDNLGVKSSSASEAKYPSPDSDKMALFRAIRSAYKAKDADQAMLVDELFAAVEYGDLPRIRRHCAQDPSLVESESQEFTPLIYASLRGQVESARTLLDLGADVNRPLSMDQRKTPLSAALEGKKPAEMVELLLSRGGDVKRVYSDSRILAHLASLRNQATVLQSLAKYGADMNAKDYKGDTPLHMAIVEQEHRSLEALMAMPQVDLHTCNGRSFRPLQLACLVDNPRAVAAILARDKSRVDEMIGQGHSAAIHVAAINDHVECVRLLVMEGGASINIQQGHSQQTALHLGCHKALVQTVEALLELGAAVNLEDVHGDTPLHLTMGGKIEGYGTQTESVAMQVTCRIEIAKMLISNGAYVDATNHAGRRPFVYGYPEVKTGVKAFMDSNPEVVKRKFGKGADSAALFSSLGLNLSSPVEGGQIGDALKGVGLPCGLCGTSKSDVTLQPCQHKCVCSACAGKVTKCPLCDAKITDRVNTGQDEHTLDPDNCKQM